MLTFLGQCPHCNSDRGFRAFGMSGYVINEYDYSGMPIQQKEYLEKKRKENPSTSFSLAGVCLSCQKPVVAEFTDSQKNQEQIRASVDTSHRTWDGVMKPIKIYPEPTPPYSHASLPDEVNAAFLDLQKMLQQDMRPHFIITGCRTVLEAAVKVLGGSGGSLKARIDDLRAKGIITAVLHAWASHVRLSGNDAAHEMEGSPADARELVEFTKIFLQFTFELPARIQAVRPTIP